LTFEATTSDVNGWAAVSTTTPFGFRMREYCAHS
jgi:hypothetical protein